MNIHTIDPVSGGEDAPVGVSPVTARRWPQTGQAPVDALWAGQAGGLPVAPGRVGDSWVPGPVTSAAGRSGNRVVRIWV